VGISLTQLPLLDDYSTLTMLLRLVLILKNGDGDASIHGFTETADVAPDCAFQCNEGEFATLDAVSAILVQEHEIVAAAYLRPDDTPQDDTPQDDTPQDDTSQDDTTQGNTDADEYGFPVEIYADSSTKPPVHFVVAANPRGSQGLGDSPKIQKIEPADGYWHEVQNYPTCRMM